MEENVAAVERSVEPVEVALAGPFLRLFAEQNGPERNADDTPSSIRALRVPISKISMTFLETKKEFHTVSMIHISLVKDYET